MDSTPPMKTPFWPGMSWFDYIPPKIHIIGDDMQKFISQISKIKSEGHFHFTPKSEKSKFQNFIGGKFQRQLFKWPPKTNGKA